MIDFACEGEIVKVTIEADTKVAKRCYSFNWNCNDEVYADLLMRNFEEKLRSELSRIREESYKSGFADAKAKRKKETCFGGYF
jgi:hypothetical protein